MTAVPGVGGAANGGTILVGETDQEVRCYVAMALRCRGFQVEFAEDGEELLGCARSARFSAVLLDLMMPRRDGLQVLGELRKANPALPVIILSSATSPEQILAALQMGAIDFLVKPITHDDLCKSLEKALNGAWQPLPLATVEAGHVKAGALFAATCRARELRYLLDKIAPSEVPVLIRGETGAGKEVVARYIHAHSKRASRVFLKLNCAALPSELVESELFGYERGAFTGAFQRKAGMFELADGGTLLLDEIGDMDFKLQAKLLQVLQDHTFQRLGGKETIRVDVRVLAATHCDLDAAITEGRFRQDLYYRLNVLPVEVAPLRERQEEILPLAEFLMEKLSSAATPALPIYGALRTAMLEYPWPGNVRELENFIQRYLILGDAEALVAQLRPRTLQKGAAQQHHLAAVPPQGETSAQPILERVSRAKEQAEGEAILAALESTHWNRKRAAELLGIDYKALLYKMRKLTDQLRSPRAIDNGAPKPRPIGVPPAEATSGTAAGSGLKPGRAATAAAS